MYICVCNGITERDIRASAEEGTRTMHDLEKCLGVGAGCGKCRSAAKQILKESRAIGEPRSESRTILSGVPA